MEGFVRLAGGPFDGQEIQPMHGWPSPVHNLDPATQEPPGTLIGWYREPIEPGAPSVFQPVLRLAS